MIGSNNDNDLRGACGSNSFRPEATSIPARLVCPSHQASIALPCLTLHFTANTKLQKINEQTTLDSDAQSQVAKSWVSSSRSRSLHSFVKQSTQPPIHPSLCTEPASRTHYASKILHRRATACTSAPLWSYIAVLCESLIRRRRSLKVVGVCTCLRSCFTGGNIAAAPK